MEKGGDKSGTDALSLLLLLLLLLLPLLGPPEVLSPCFFSLHFPLCFLLVVSSTHTLIPSLPLSPLIRFL